MHLSAVNFHDWRPSSISTPKISHVTKNGQWLGVNKKSNHTTHIGSFESKWKKKKRKKKRNTTNNKNNDGEIKLELIKIVIIATTVTMKMIMGKILSDNNNNDSTNKQMKSWSFSKRRRQQLQNINNSLCSNKARLFILELNRFLGAKDIFHFCEDSNTLHQSEFNLDGLSGMWLENWVIFGDVMDLIIIDNK